jgi:hypothetical protein
MFDVVGDVEDAIAKLLGSERRVDVMRLTRARNRLEYAWLRALGEYDRSGDWAAEGFVNAAAALRARTGIAHGVASASLKLAGKLHELALVSEAFAAGDISRQHAAVIAEAFTPERAAALRGLEQPLVDAAMAATPRQLHQIVERITGALDGDDGAAAAHARYQRRRLHLSRTLDGMVMGDFVLDGEDGELLIDAVQQMARRHAAAGDGRTPAQRRADGLVDLVRCGASHADLGPARRPREVIVTVDVGEIGARGGRDLAAEVRAHAGRLPAATRRRLTCDAAVARVITDGPSLPIDVGRATRTIPPQIWRALVVRDGGCTYPDCDRPAQWCDAHHVVHWEHGGATRLDNLRLLCRVHHRLVHEGGHDPP